MPKIVEIFSCLKIIKNFFQFFLISQMKFFVAILAIAAVSFANGATMVKSPLHKSGGVKNKYLTSAEARDSFHDPASNIVPTSSNWETSSEWSTPTTTYIEPVALPSNIIVYFFKINIRDYCLESLFHWIAIGRSWV